MYRPFYYCILALRQKLYSPFYLPFTTLYSPCMSAKYRNFFLLVGLAAIVIMLLTFEWPDKNLWQQVKSSYYWFIAVIVLWLPIYLLNAWAWYVIINDGNPEHKVGFWRVFKYTISGYALNYVTPVGVLGGEPYRIMELTPYVGAAKASSSVILYAMMHIYSHFWFWAFSIVLFVALYFSIINWAVAAILLVMTAFCALGIYFFMVGYNNGLAVRALRFFGKWPLIGKRVRSFAEKNNETVERVDRQIAELHAQRKSTFYLSLFLEFLARVVGCAEVLFIVFMLNDNSHITFVDCILMQAFMSLFANLMFFIPMEMGTREGGFAMISKTLAFNQAVGVLTGLVTRVRELFWIAVGLLLMKIGNKKKS